MKYRAFEEAAAEARAGIEELEAEIDRLKARRDLLQVLEALLGQVQGVFPMSSEAAPAEDGARPTDAAVAERAAGADRLPERDRERLAPRERPPEPPPAPQETAIAEELFSADSLREGYSALLQTQESPTVFTAETTEDMPAEEQPSGAETPVQGECEALPSSETTADTSAAASAETTAAERTSFTDLLSRRVPYSLRKQGWPADDPVDPHEIRKKLL